MSSANVLILSPGYPSEIPHFVSGLAQVGARVFGVGDQHPSQLPASVKACCHDYLHVPSMWDEESVIRQLREWLRGQRLDRIECLWEPGMVVAARLREAFGVAGLTVAGTLPFRDKEKMKQVLDASGIRTPRHFAACTAAQCWESAQEIGFPLILKPVAGAGSADTYRVNDADELRAVLPRLQHVAEVSVEEFVDGEEYTFDTITIDGKITYYNVAWYRPRPLIARSNEWISPQVIALRDIEDPLLTDGIKMGFDVIEALQFGTGFTHMEWYRKADGEVVFGEIGARPPGAHQVDQMNYACDIDVFREWGRAISTGSFDADVQRTYNVATVYKRAQGAGRISAIQGLEALYEKYGEHVVANTLLPVGTPRRDWLKTLVSDGFIMLRHPDLDKTLEMADAFGSELTLYAE